MDEAVQRFSELGKGSLLAKLNIESAYRVHPEDRLLLGNVVEREPLCRCFLPFGLRSAPKIFNAGQQGTRAIHYLDDYLYLVPPTPNWRSLRR